MGKIYTLLTHKIAGEIYLSVPGLDEVYVWLGSQIGKPIGEPLVASAQLVLLPGVALVDVRQEVKGVIEGELTTIDHFTGRLARGELPVW